MADVRLPAGLALAGNARFHGLAEVVIYPVNYQTNIRQHVHNTLHRADNLISILGK
jgi:hypothetical protein